jgi:hypothetical protein
LALLVPPLPVVKELPPQANSTAQQLTAAHRLPPLRELMTPVSEGPFRLSSIYGRSRPF